MLMDVASSLLWQDVSDNVIRTEEAVQRLQDHQRQAPAHARPPKQRSLETLRRIRGQPHHT